MSMSPLLAAGTAASLPPAPTPPLALLLRPPPTVASPAGLRCRMVTCDNRRSRGGRRSAIQSVYFATELRHGKQHCWPRSCPTWRVRGYRFPHGVRTPACTQYACLCACCTPETPPAVLGACSGGWGQDERAANIVAGSRSHRALQARSHATHRPRPTQPRWQTLGCLASLTR